MNGWSKRAISRARKDGRETGYALLSRLKGRGVDEVIDMGEWWAIRPTAWLQEAVLEGDKRTLEELRVLDLHWLSSLNSILTPVGWKGIISGKWNDGRLVVTRVLGKVKNETQT